MLLSLTQPLTRGACRLPVVVKKPPAVTKTPVATKKPVVTKTPAVTNTPVATKTPVVPTRDTSPRATTPVMVQSGGASPALSPSVSGLSPAQILHAYGFDQVPWALSNGGAGQTIAIVDAYDDPNAFSDLQQFDAQFGLPDPPSFKRVAQDGSTNYPPKDPAGAGNGSWELEESLDVEWAHAIAPAASIVLIETNDNSFDNLLTAGVGLARTLPGVSVVSMSFGGGEFVSELTYDSLFTTPTGHTNITYLAATGDHGSPATYPAFSSKVVAVGATSLQLTGSGDYSSESAWSGSGGGYSFSVAQPTYQKGIVAASSVTRRTVPDVSMVGDPGTGLAVYDSYDYPNSPWRVVGGTSASTPIWAGLIAIADQGRAMLSEGTLDGYTQTLPALYSLPASDFHDVTTGTTNGSPQYTATSGYDMATGRGTPIANEVIYGLMGSGTITGQVFEDDNSDGVLNGGDAGIAGVQVYLDTNNNGVYDPGTVTTVANNTAMTIPDNNVLGVTSAVTVSGATGSVSNLKLTLNITHPRDSDLSAYLVAPDGSEILLFSGLTGTNFSATVLTDQAGTRISAGSGSFTGSYYPADALADFNGEAANGTWSLKVFDSVTQSAGTLNSWSLSVTTGAADVYATTTDAAGNYSFGNVPLGTSYTVRQVTPTGYVQTTPANGSGVAVPSLLGNVTHANIADFPTSVAAGLNDSIYLATDPADKYLEITTGTSAWWVPLTNAPALTFNLQGNNSVLIVDFSNGSPIAGNITLNTIGNSAQELRILGKSAGQTFALSNSQLALDGGGAVLYRNLPTLTLNTCTVNVTEDLSGLQNINVNAGATLNF
ncbi:MAG TPA: proprotein convertase P-domain-containing protein [Phycisphaerae bacterium]|nr:proprotein convertase P-domain-containing protein [Phycisphaerae bacterium]